VGRVITEQAQFYQVTYFCSVAPSICWVLVSQYGTLSEDGHERLDSDLEGTVLSWHLPGAIKEPHENCNQDKLYPGLGDW
jgi:hypothetical protein